MKSTPTSPFQSPFKTSFRSFFLVLSGCLLIGSASAQEQTVESAQKFLSLSLAKAGYHSTKSPWVILYNQADIRARSNRLWGVARSSGSSYVSKFTPAPGNRCESDVVVDSSTKKVWIAWSTGQEYLSGAAITENKRISWANSVTGVEGVTDSVQLNLKGGEVIKFFLGSESLVSRVAYAMEFLRINCDVAAATGF